MFWYDLMCRFTILCGMWPFMFWITRNMSLLLTPGKVTAPDDSSHSVQPADHHVDSAVCPSPHPRTPTVLQTEDDLWCTVESRDEIRRGKVQRVVFVERVAEVGELGMTEKKWGATWMRLLFWSFSMMLSGLMSACTMRAS